MNQRVVIVQRRLTHYRVPLFEALRDELALRDVRLDLLVGHGTAAEEAKQDGGRLAWATMLPTRYFVGGRVCWQPFDKHLGDAGLVIVTQENKLINNHLLLLRRRSIRLAFWGHGANLQSSRPGGARERFKRWTTHRADWWFAYTQLSADLVAATGFPRERITVLDNAVDTTEMRRSRQQLDADDLGRRRRALGFDDAPVGVFLGSLYAGKRLDFLFAAAAAIRQEIGDFRLLIIGDGPERAKVQAWCAGHPWARWVGAQKGPEKVAHAAIAQIMLNPGLVGLAVLDSFALGVPMITISGERRSPEIAYLCDGFNGVETADDIGQFAQAAVAVLRDPALRARLVEGCGAAAQRYTLENMVARFATGIGRALAYQPE